MQAHTDESISLEIRDFAETLERILEEGKPFHIRFFIIDEDLERRIETAITRIFERYGKPDYSGVIYTCIKELIVNGTKANLKRILFEKRSLRIDNEDDYLKGMLEFRNYLTAVIAASDVEELKRRDFWVDARFVYSPNGVRIEIINNAHITPIEDKRLREKLKKAMGYEDILQFYMEQGDELEGAGMGIALIVMLMRGIEQDPSLFRIGNTHTKQTFARLEIPLSPAYVAIRQRH
jgi:hypothetical protein